VNCLKRHGYSGALAPGMAVAHATFNATVLLLFLVPAFR
jgi:hypothetical protein